MKARRRGWEEIHIGKRPLLFKDWPGENFRPSSFPIWYNLQPPPYRDTAQIHYERGWTALIFSNSEIYFADETLTFDGMIDLIRERFLLTGEIRRHYVD